MIAEALKAQAVADEWNSQRKEERRIKEEVLDLIISTYENEIDRLKSEVKFEE